MIFCALIFELNIEYYGSTNWTRCLGIIIKNLSYGWIQRSLAYVLDLQECALICNNDSGPFGHSMACVLIMSSVWDEIGLKNIVKIEIGFCIFNKQIERLEWRSITNAPILSAHMPTKSTACGKEPESWSTSWNPFLDHLIKFLRLLLGLYQSQTILTFSCNSIAVMCKVLKSHNIL